jgi:hypothetical protein
MNINRAGDGLNLWYWNGDFYSISEICHYGRGGLNNCVTSFPVLSSWCLNFSWLKIGNHFVNRISHSNSKWVLILGIYSQQHVTIYICCALLALNGLEIRAVQGPKCIAWCAVDCTFNTSDCTIWTLFRSYFKGYKC